MGAETTMITINKTTLRFAGSLMGLCLAQSAQASTSMFFNAGQEYRRVNDSPFWTGSSDQASGNFRIETFEDGLLNAAGLRGTGGTVRGPGSGTDSVDGDGNHALDGRGTGGSSYQVRAHDGHQARASFTFTANALGHLPTFAGLVWTDGRPDAKVTFKAYDAHGNVIARLVTTLGDTSTNGTTAEDRFLGASYSRGIARITITASLGNFEIDHIQFGFRNFTMAVVPVPPALALGAVGLLGVGVARRRYRKSVDDKN
jgi:hypothetical protein